MSDTQDPKDTQNNSQGKKVGGKAEVSNEGGSEEDGYSEKGCRKKASIQ